MRFVSGSEDLTLGSIPLYACFEMMDEFAFICNFANPQDEMRVAAAIRRRVEYGRGLQFYSGMDVCAGGAAEVACGSNCVRAPGESCGAPDGMSMEGYL
jgi:hypothetical protein